MTAAPSTAKLEASLAARIERVTRALGKPDPRSVNWQVTTLALDQTDTARASRRTTKPTRAFLERADAFVHAHEIALAVRRTDADGRAMMYFDVESIRRGHVRGVKGLAYLEEAFFTYWHEAPFAQTRAFWKAVARAKLPFERRDRVGEILERGRIRNRYEYDLVMDLVGLVGADGPSRTARTQLNRMIAAYEKARAR